MKQLGSFGCFLIFSSLFPCLLFAQPQESDCIRRYPQPSADALRRARCFAGQHQWAQALEEVRAYRKIHSKSDNAAVLQAEILLELHLPLDANEVISSALAVHPDSVPLLTFDGQLAEKLGDPERAEQLYLRCTRNAPGEVAVWLRLGDFYLQNNGPKAIAAYRHAIQIQSGNALAHAGLASALAMIPQRQEALREFESAIRLNSHARSPDARVEFQFAEFLREIENYRESIRYYSLVIEQAPNFTDAFFGRGISHLKIENWDLAKRDLETCLREGDRRVATLNLLLKIYQHQGDLEQVTACARQIDQLSATDLASKNEGNHIADLLRKAALLEQQKKSKEALETYTQLLKDHPEVDAASYGLGIANANLGLLDQSESDFKHFLASNPSSPLGRLQLGKVLLRKKLPQEARVQFQLAKDGDPLLLDARLGIAASYIHQSKFPAAISELNEANRLPGVHLESHLMLAEAFYKVGQPKEALKEVNFVLLQDPANSAAQKMQASLSPDR